MEMSSQAVASTLATELDKPLSREAHHEPVEVLDHPLEVRKKKINWRAVTSFFILGLLIGLPSTVITTGSNVMFTGITGVYEVCASVTGAVASMAAPFVLRLVSYNTHTVICIVASALAYIICTLPNPLDGPAPPSSKAGPVIGTMLGGFVYAFGTNVYMAVAAFFPPEAVLALSAGSGCSVVLGPALYTGIMAGFHQDWRRTFLVMFPTAVGIPLVWWGLTDSKCRLAAEKSRLASLAKSRQQTDNADNSTSSEPRDSEKSSANEVEAAVSADDSSSGDYKPGFGPERTRTGLLIKTILPKYVLPLIFCTSSSIVTLLGTAPSLQTLNRFHEAPSGNLQFQLVFLSFGTAQFVFSTLAAAKPIPLVWIWTGVQVTLLTIGLLQLAYPFLTYYGVWIVILFLTGGCVGGGVTNTNYKIAEDFRKSGEPDEVRSFAMSFAGLGNFGGDALGGAFGVMVQQLATKYLKPSP
ncbi:MAG: hypothetical protein M1821_000388 [Bathelium mastoideum]|nr:MAG: hypothetical protein M1821_000388 [Bathelium mastoideum]KAI9686197.1 MAG: hypothetical protein M1822_003852 [Bathelium mastoideum]